MIIRLLEGEPLVESAMHFMLIVDKVRPVCFVDHLGHLIMGALHFFYQAEVMAYQHHTSGGRIMEKHFNSHSLPTLHTPNQIRCALGSPP